MSQDPDSILLLKVMIEKWLFPGNKCKKETLCKALREIGKEEIARAVENSPELEGILIWPTHCSAHYRIHTDSVLIVCYLLILQNTYDGHHE